MEWNDFTSLTSEDMRAIWDFNTKDPFSILGLHPLNTDRGLKTVIRAYQPQASFIRGESCDGEFEFDFMKLGNTGFFEAILDKEYEPFFYNLIIRQDDGNEYTLTDPYAFLPVLSDFDRHLISSGTHYELYRKLGANLVEHQGFKGVHFAVWAPNAHAVSVVGSFNSWDGRRHQMRMLGSTGIWEIFIPNIGEGELYRFEIHGADGNLHVKVDPLAKLSEVRPATASITTHLDGYEWGDDLYMTTHWATKVFGSPMNIYEVHAGSWRRDPANPDRFLNWDELAETLIPYLKEMGYTHVEFLPLAEHPLDESWGYQVTGYYSPTSRYGTPDQFRHFVDLCHQNEIGVIVDWVPAHFPKDAHALGRFDGTACYEHADPRQGEHPHWGTYIFNLGRNEVKNFTRPPEQGGLGFHYKWNMGWMNDFLSYIQHEPIHRKYHHNQLTFSMVYAYSENFIQVFSHDEVVHGKGSMLGKMPGDNWQKFANLRLTYAFQYAHPGKKLNFMGNDFGQFREWNEKRSLDWHLISWDSHGKLLQMMKVLNHLYKENAPFWEIDHYYTGFEWIWCDDADNSIVSFVRKDDHGNQILCVFNFTPVVRNDYRLGAPTRGKWKEIFNTDASMFGGSNVGNFGEVWTQDIPWQNRQWSLNIKLPPLAAVYFRLER